MAYQRDGGGGGGTSSGAGNGGAGGAGIGGGSSPGPAAVNPAQPPGQALVAQTTSSAGRPIPIAYGTVKAPVLLLEKQPPTSAPAASWTSAQNNHVGEIWSNAGNTYRCLLGGSSGTTGPTGTGADPAAWASGTAYTVGQLVTSNGNVYQCTVAGTGGSAGPIGTGTNILDNPFGSTVPHWCYMGATPYPVVVENGVIWKYLQAQAGQIYTQQFLGAVCEGPATGALSLWWDKERIVGPSSTSLGKMLQLGLGPDACNQVLPAAFDSAGYQHTAVVAPLSGLGVITDTQAQLPDLAVEVQGQLFGATTPDASPADIVNDILTHSRRGAGWATSRVDASITGTAAGAYRVYCDASGWRLSMLIDTQRPALALLADVLAATNSDAVWSGGALKVVPLGDQPIASPVYGSTGYVPANVAQYALGIDDFLDKANPVAVQRISDADTFNDWPVEYTDRAQGYSRVPVEDPDQTDVERRGGMVRASTVALPMTYANGTYVTSLSRILAQRSLNVRNTYTFRVPWRYILLEPTDIVTLTEPGIGLVNTPVRITALEEGEDGTLTITAEDYPAGVQAATAYAPQVGDGYTPNEKATVAIVPTLVDGIKVGLVSNIVSAACATSAINDNLWPNPTSETSPPPGVTVLNNGSSPEWDYRYNAGSGAYSGSWVRQIVANGSNVFFGFTIPVSPGEKFFLSMQAQVVSGNGWYGIGVFFLNSGGGVISTSGVIGPQGPNTWGYLSYTTPAAPAGTVSVKIAVENQYNTTSNTCQYDSLYARRIVDTSIIAAGTSGQLLTTNSAGSSAWVSGTSAAYNTSAGQSLSISSATIVNYGTVEVDTDSAVTTGAAWKFTTPAGKGGTYSVKAAASVAVTGSEVFIGIYKNGTEVRRGARHLYDSVFNITGITVGADLVLAAGDFVDVRVYSANGGSLEAFAIANYVTIHRVLGL